MDIKKIKPTLDRILVERLKEENVTKSGLLIDAASAGVKIGETGNLEETEHDEAAAEPAFKALVITVGPDTKTVKKGDIVVVSKFSGLALETKFPRYLLIRELDVLAFTK